MANGRTRGADSDTANRRTATDNDDTKYASVVLGPVHAPTSSHPGILPLETCRHYTSTLSFQNYNFRFFFFHTQFTVFIKNIFENILYI